MSEKAPHVLGGTRPNVEKRFDILTESEPLANGAATVSEQQQQEDQARAEEQEQEQEEDDEDEEKPSMYTQQAEDDVPEVTTIESLCMNCREDGTTKLLLTLIPYFREVILMSFECDHCGFKNSEVQFGGKVQEQAAKIELNVTDSEDLNRQIIKSDTGSIYFPDLDFEIPKETQRGTINTIEVRSRSPVAPAGVDQTHTRRPCLGQCRACCRRRSRTCGCTRRSGERSTRRPPPRLTSSS